MGYAYLLAKTNLTGYTRSMNITSKAGGCIDRDYVTPVIGHAPLVSHKHPEKIHV